jgi:ketosteroid isomerase-like protein
MGSKLSAEIIRQYAKALDDAIEKRDIAELVTYFCDDCDIELLGINLTGKEGLGKAIAWMYRYLKELVIIPVTIMVDGNTFFEEFVVEAKVRGGKEVKVNMAEVLVYDDDYKVRSLRLYFDRLELAEAFISNFIERLMIKQVIKASTKGLL